MSTKTAIEWTDHTFNPWWGCSRVSAGCLHCYAETLGHRFGVEWGEAAARRPASETQWDQPRKWNEAAKRAGRRARVFCASMADVFDTAAPADALGRLWDMIRFTPWLEWQLLTKRPENIRAALPADWGHGYRNVQLGVSVEHQAAADTRIPLLMEIPARTRFLSCEPLLGTVDLSNWLNRCTYCDKSDILAQGGRHQGCGLSLGLDWIIVGGESGHGARAMLTAWARGLRDQAAAAGVAFFFKQWGEWGPYNCSRDKAEELAKLLNPKTFDFPVRHGRRAAGRLLDGCEHNEFPEGARA